MLEVCSKTDIGKKRNINEDSFLTKRLGEFYILAVADGLGGHAAGEVASKIALIEIEEFLKANIGKQDLQKVMEAGISKANKEIYRLSKENPSYAEMRTTIVMAVVAEKNVLIANVGDSRAYLIGNTIGQVTKDHSLVQELLDKKIITVEEAFHHPQKNIVTKVLGGESEVKPDLYTIELDQNVLLLCSDGLTGSLRDEEIMEIVVDSKDIDNACAKLIDSANEKGGKDNITVILAKG
ncbi:MAG: Stp1/IreP family PP2C-type Ser/Thr phosphatase [Candidatus Hydrothermarchaeales archaeon]